MTSNLSSNQMYRWNHSIFLAVTLLVCCFTSTNLFAQDDSLFATDIQSWVDQKFVHDSVPPFSFVYGDEQSADLLQKWEKSISKSKSSNTGEQKMLVSYRDTKSGLFIQCTITSFTQYGAVELDLRLKNTGKDQTPIIESVQSMDYIIRGIGKTTLHWSKGSTANFDDFMPQEKSFVNQGESLRLTPGGEGRSSSMILPFFNAVGEGRGVIMGIGWTGEWAAGFKSVAEGLSFQAGMDKTHFVLHPNEEIRMPKTLLLFYRGDRWDGQNMFRRFMLAHHHPKVKGKPLEPKIMYGVFGNTKAEVHLNNIGKLIEHNIPFDYYWVDAGWYGNKGGDWFTNAGNWKLVKETLPDGFKPLSEKLEKKDRHLMVWFEPERVYKGTWWYNQHPEYLLNENHADNSLLNLGNPKARTFVTDFISEKIKEFGLTTGCYRQDFNIAPLSIWRSQDASDRQGITEARYVEGLYAYWDALLERFPEMIIDNCASGGKRIDIETTSRSVPYWRTDGPRDPVAHQCHNYGLMAWIPFSATSVDREGNDYDFRSSMNSSICINWQHSGDGTPWWNFPEDFPYDWAKKSVDQYVSIRNYYLGDYYPLTPYSQARDIWMGWQLNCPEKGEGMVQAFRRENCFYTSASFKLRNLERNAIYLVKNIDTEGIQELSGRTLMEEGLSIAISTQPGAAIVIYKKK